MAIHWHIEIHPLAVRPVRCLPYNSFHSYSMPPALLKRKNWAVKNGKIVGIRKVHLIWIGFISVASAIFWLSTSPVDWWLEAEITKGDLVAPNLRDKDPSWSVNQRVAGQTQVSQQSEARKDETKDTLNLQEVRKDLGIPNNQERMQKASTGRKDKNDYESRENEKELNEHYGEVQQQGTGDQQEEELPQQSKEESTEENTRRHQPAIVKDEDLAKLQRCFPSNSERWLRGPRHGNVDDSLLDDDFLENMILFGHSSGNFRPDTALKQSMCHPDSRFLNAKDTQADDRSIQLWIVRLTYLAMHKMQHQFAAPEAVQRLHSNGDSECNQLAQKYNIGKFDYECPDGKFFVVPIENLGLGAVMRTTAVSGLLAALATNRTVLFINHAPVGPDVIKHSWYHASCDRLDAQCFFHASSPCVLTYEDLERAPVLKDFRNVSKLYRSPAKMVSEEWFDNERTIILPVKTVARRAPKNIPEILRNFTLDFMRNLPSQDDPSKAVLQKVADRFISKVHEDKVIQLMSYGLVIYCMRPHLQSQRKLQKVIQKIVPPSKFHPEATLGLPIRASDKCVEESECLTFEQYMRVLSQLWNRHQSNLTHAMQQSSIDKLSIVLTTESENVMDEKDGFMNNQSLVKNMPFEFDFITNDYDIKQDSGNPQNNIPQHNLDVELEKNNADEVMLSMISSLQIQLLARYSIGNCCSNFHRILFELLDGGCGAAYQSDPECLQTNEDPEFRICCVWDNSDECKKKKVQEKIRRKWYIAKQVRMQKRWRRQQNQNMLKGQ